ncbi:MAG: hypothetical protein L3J83_06165 [Proteobacteria bacterium]|nr:hypothetical protein [Pseudomonadota bacterium]
MLKLKPNRHLHSGSTLVLWLAFAVLFAPSLVYGELIKYNLQVNPNNPQIVHVSVDTSTLGGFSLERARSLPFSNTVHSPVIQCKTKLDSHTAEYEKAIKCKEITWSIHFNQLDTKGTDVSKQRNLYSSSGWWVLFEWGDIPRLKGYSNAEICVISSNAKYPDKCRALPTLEMPPLIMSWGQASRFEIAENIKFSIYADNIKLVLNDKSWTQLMSQYKYLQHLFSTKGARKQNIDITWIGIDASAGSMGGASGSQAFVSNYIVKNKQVSQDNLSKLHLTSGHELFHMLTTFSYPIWITESLAHYYGYKSLVVAKISHQTPVEIWQSSRIKTPHASTGLYVASEMVENQNDMSYYGLFYNKGAAFWQELDDELVKKGVSLDAYIALLSKGEGNTTGTQLNKEFTTAMKKTLGKRKFSQLISKYLL